MYCSLRFMSDGCIKKKADDANELLETGKNFMFLLEILNVL